MTKSILTTLLLIAIGTTTLLGQNRMKFKHRLSQKRIYDAVFVLLNWNPTSNSGKGGYTDTLEIGGDNKLRSIIKLDSKGNILVDFWQIKSGQGFNRKWIFWKEQIVEIDPFKNQSKIVNSQTPYNIDNPPKLTDGRNSIGKATGVLRIPFSGFTFGIATLPFRLRGEQDISSTEKSKKTVSSPRPDVAITGGWTFGKSVITNRSIINYSATFGAFVGLTGAEIKDGVVKSGTELYGSKKTQTNPAMSYGINGTFARNNIGLVVALGFDNSMGSYSNDWIYQNKPWIGIGLSASLGIF
ncbi:MAG: hypothetical protein IM577_11505 [Chitinophagaceae bacterium]|jgi:hypothetical protein|nr:hypothetical protein [Chitinophagaceae bacterium]